MPRVSRTVLTVDGIGQLSFEGAMAATYKRAVRDQQPLVEISDSEKTAAGRLNETVLIPTARIAMVTEVIKDETAEEQEQRQKLEAAQRKLQQRNQQLQVAQQEAQLEQAEKQMQQLRNGEPTASRATPQQPGEVIEGPWSTGVPAEEGEQPTD